MATEHRSELRNLYQLARELQLPVAWLKRQAVLGHLPCLKIGQRLLFNRSAVESELARRARGDGTAQSAGGGVL